MLARMPSGLPPELQELLSARHSAFWVSQGPATVQLWRSLRADRLRTGLVPILLESDDHDVDRPWDTGELAPGDMSSPEEHDAATLLAQWWDEYSETDEDDEDDELTAPFGRRWPGLVPSQVLSVDPEEQADRCAVQMLAEKPHLRLGLVAAERSADAPSVTGWQGPANYIDDTAQVSAVLRSWEDRFGARLVGMGFADLYVSVPAPPASRAEALPIAAEHFALCPDNIGQMDGLAAYADGLVGESLWSFWWD